MSRVAAVKGDFAKSSSKGTQFVVVPIQFEGILSLSGFYYEGAMFNNPFVRAMGLMAICYLVLQALGWGLNSLVYLTQGFSFWVKYTLIPHAWQIALAIGVIYLLLTAVTTSKD